jgi:hypothetical protein
MFGAFALGAADRKGDQPTDLREVSKLVRQLIQVLLQPLRIAAQKIRDERKLLGVVLPG